MYQLPRYLESKEICDEMKRIVKEAVLLMFELFGSDFALRNWGKIGNASELSLYSLELCTY
jgi:hypothetical protein